VGGLQSGKTIAGAVWSRIKYDQYPKDNGLIAAPTYKILEQSTLPKFFEINEDLQRYYKKQAGVIEVPNRGRIYIRSTENPNVIEGMTLRWIWPDEAGQMKREAWINFQGRLSILKGDFFATTTPYTLNWLYTEFYDQWKKGNPDYCVIQCRSKDNPYFPDEEYERVKTTMDGRTFRRRYDGIFEQMEGLVYEDFNPSIHVIPPRTIQFKEVICGIDWGFTAPAAVVVIGIDGDGRFYVIDEYYKTGKTTQEIIERVKYFTEQYKIRFYYPDPAEPDRLEEMKRFGLFPREVVKNKDSSKRGVDQIRELIRQNRFYVFEPCRFTQEEFSLYQYPEEKEGKIDEDPIKDNDHLMDALNYAIRTYSPPQKTYQKRAYQATNSITGY